MTKEVTMEEGIPWKKITLEVAERMIAAAQRWASNAGVPCCVTVVDKAGAVVALERMDGCGFPGIATNAAIGKAYTAAQACVSNYLLSKMLDPRYIGEIPGSYYIGLMTQLNCRINLIPGGEPIRDEEMNVIGGVGCGGLPDAVGEISDMTVCRVAISSVYE